MADPVWRSAEEVLGSDGDHYALDFDVLLAIDEANEHATEDRMEELLMAGAQPQEIAKRLHIPRGVVRRFAKQWRRIQNASYRERMTS